MFSTYLVVFSKSRQTYTVEYDRNNKPTKAYVVGRLHSNGHRFVANEADPSTLDQLASLVREPIGRSGNVRNQGGKNLFSFQGSSKL